MVIYIQDIWDAIIRAQNVMHSQRLAVRGRKRPKQQKRLSVGTYMYKRWLENERQVGQTQKSEAYQVRQKKSVGSYMSMRDSEDLGLSRR